MTGYYDYVLGLIPTALIGITAFLNLVGWSLTVALPTGASVALGLIVHALFVKGPVIDSIETAASNDPVVGGSASSGGAASPGAAD